MRYRIVVFAISIAGALFAAPRPAATHGSPAPEGCHSHEGVDEEHCHLEISLSEALVEAPHPVAVTVDRVTRIVAGVVSARPPAPTDSDLGLCRSNEDCSSGERCVGGYCIEQSFQPLGTLFDSLQMTVKTGGPGAALRLRW